MQLIKCVSVVDFTAFEAKVDGTGMSHRVKVLDEVLRKFSLDERFAD